MGYRPYDEEAHQALTRQQAALPRERVFQQTRCHPDMNPQGLIKRESRDSPLHPDSLAIMFMLDVTGSMGDIPVFLARDSLPTFMQSILSCGVTDPQVLFGAIGDFRMGDFSSLQVGQFESEGSLMNHWLKATYLEGGGKGNGQESYDLAFYVAGRHTGIDCFEKRGRRGYLFLTGDEEPYDTVSRRDVQQLIGVDIGADIPLEDMIAETARRYHPFFLIPDQQRADCCQRRWRELLGDHVICLTTHEDTCLTAATVVALTEGLLVDLSAVEQKLLALRCNRDQVNRVLCSIEDYAACIGRSGGQRLMQPAELPRHGRGCSGNRRVR
jgi:hypothetical protein